MCWYPSREIGSSWKFIQALRWQKPVADPLPPHLPERSHSALGANVVLDDNYDDSGKVAAISDRLAGGSGYRDMSYDALDSFAGVAAGPAQVGNGSFAYNPLDNLRVLDQGSHPFRYHDSRLAQIKSPTGALLHICGYDARGNTTSKDGSTLSFGREN